MVSLATERRGGAHILYVYGAERWARIRRRDSEARTREGLMGGGAGGANMFSFSKEMLGGSLQGVAEPTDSSWGEELGWLSSHVMRPRGEGDRLRCRLGVPPS